MSETPLFQLLQMSSSQILVSTTLVKVLKSQSNRSVRIKQHRAGTILCWLAGVLFTVNKTKWLYYFVFVILCVSYPKQYWTRNQRFSVRRTSVSSVSLSQSVNSQWLTGLLSLILEASASHCGFALACYLIFWNQCFALSCDRFFLTPVLRAGLLSLQLVASASHWLVSSAWRQCFALAL